MAIAPYIQLILYIHNDKHKNYLYIELNIAIILYLQIK